MNSTASARALQSSVQIVLLGGLAVGVLDITDAMLFWWFRAGLTPVRIVQSVAAGLIGREAAASGGLASAVLGAVLHFSIALSVMTVCYFLARRIR